MGDSQSTSPRWINDSIRNVISFIFDQPAYWILGIMYQLFFNVASADLFSNETIVRFYGRVQIILGVFMMFQLAMTILRGIVNPGTFTDAKSGAGNFITRVATSLLLITLMMPISTPARNEYEKQINNNGILFGTLYSLQHRILSNNTIGRLVLGTNDTEATYMSGNDTELKKSSRIFTSTILKGFYLINLIPENQRQGSGNESPASIVANRYCPSYDYSAYERIDAEPSEIIAMVDESCNGSLGSKGYYVIAYNPIISAIVAYIFAFILLSFTIDVAVRAVKLAVLRLIAPIPLISYMDPKGGKDSAFNAWVKLLTSTYLDLFIRLAVVYFVIFLIQDIMIHGIYMNHTSGVIGILSFIIICIGLFVFAKQSPKFIKQAIGLKDDGGKLFSGFGELAAVGAIGAGVVGGAISRGIGTATNTNGNLGKKIAAGIGGGIAGAVSGGVSTGRTYWGQKEADRKALMNHVRSNNARNYSNASDDSTPFGRFVAGLQANAGFRNDLQKFDEKVARYQRAEGAWKSVQNALDSDGWVGSTQAEHQARGGYYSATNFTASNGDIILESNATNHGRFSLKDIKDAQARMKSSGRYSQQDLERMDKLVKSVEKSRFDYVRKSGGGDNLETPRERQIYEGISQIMETANKHSGDADGVFRDFVGHSNMEDTYFDGHMSDMFKGSSFAAGAEAGQIKSSSKYAQAKANAQRAEQQNKK